MLYCNQCDRRSIRDLNLFTDLIDVVLSRDENITNDAILEITDTSSHRAKMTKAQVKSLIHCHFSI